MQGAMLPLSLLSSICSPCSFSFSASLPLCLPPSSLPNPFRSTCHDPCHDPDYPHCMYMYTGQRRQSGDKYVRLPSVQDTGQRTNLGDYFLIHKSMRLNRFQTCSKNCHCSCHYRHKTQTNDSARLNLNKCILEQCTSTQSAVNFFELMYTCKQTGLHS